MSAGVESALITGATGFIGAALARRLAGSGARVTCLVRAESPRLGRLAGLPHCTVIEVTDFEDHALRRSLTDVEFEVVFHLASYGVDPGDRDKEQLALGNVALMESLLLGTADRPLRRFISTGSCAEYGAVAEPERLTEDHPLAPISPYGAAKAAAEFKGRALARELDVPFVPLRLFGVYGAGEAERRLVPHLISHLRRREAPSLTAGEQARDLMYIDDMVEALIQAAVAPGIALGTPYNLCTGEPVRIREVAERVRSLLGDPGVDLGLGRRPYRSDEAMWIIGDPARFQAATGFQPKVTLTEGIRRTIAHSMEEP